MSLRRGEAGGVSPLLFPAEPLGGGTGDRAVLEELERPGYSLRAADVVERACSFGGLS